jgi:hypothetical protein
VIRCELDQPPLVICEWDTDRDDELMTSWLDRDPELHALIASAIELSGEREQAA